jgi:hypothetical protein
MYARLQRDWGNSFVEVAGYVSRNDRADWHAILEHHPQFFIKVVEEFGRQAMLVASNTRSPRFQKASLTVVKDAIAQVQKRGAAGQDLLERGMGALGVLPNDTEAGRALMTAFIEAGVDLNTPRSDNNGLTHFMAFAKEKVPSLTRWLRDTHGGNCFLKDENGWTALDWAANNGHIGAAQLLMETGVDPYRPTPRRPSDRPDRVHGTPAETLSVTYGVEPSTIEAWVAAGRARLIVQQAQVTPVVSPVPRRRPSP